MVMASEYLLKLAREQELPEKKRELTPKEKRQNWWHYHKGYVLAGVAVALFMAAVIRDVFFDRAPEPDYKVACIGSSYLPQDTVTALETALAELGEDLNQDGQVLVKVSEYPLFADESNYQTLMAAQVQLSADMDENGSFIFLLEDPAAFQEQFGLLAYPDGTVPAEGEDVSRGLYCRWSDCPVLAGLELGEYAQYYSDGTVTGGDNQEVLSGLYVARRKLWEEETDALAGAAAFWQKLTEDADF